MCEENVKIVDDMMLLCPKFWAVYACGGSTVREREGSGGCSTKQQGSAARPSHQKDGSCYALSCVSKKDWTSPKKMEHLDKVFNPVAACPRTILYENRECPPFKEETAAVARLLSHQSSFNQEEV